MNYTSVGRNTVLTRDQFLKWGPKRISGGFAGFMGGLIGKRIRRRCLIFISSFNGAQEVEWMSYIDPCFMLNE
jgi:hypothetical protein